jgi:hypothetical protein
MVTAVESVAVIAGTLAAALAAAVVTTETKETLYSFPLLLNLLH